MKSAYTRLLSVATLLTLVFSLQSAYGVRDIYHGHQVITQFRWNNAKTNTIISSHVQNAIITADGGTINCPNLVSQEDSCYGWGKNEISNVQFGTEFGSSDWFDDCGGRPCVSADWWVTERKSSIPIYNQNYTYQNATMIACIDKWFCTDPVSWSRYTYQYVVINMIPANTPVSIISHYYYLSPDGTLMYRIDHTMNVQKGYG